MPKKNGKPRVNSGTRIAQGPVEFQKTQFKYVYKASRGEKPFCVKIKTKVKGYYQGGFATAEEANVCAVKLRTELQAEFTWKPDETKTLLPTMRAAGDRASRRAYAQKQIAIVRQQQELVAAEKQLASEVFALAPSAFAFDENEEENLSAQGLALAARKKKESSK